MRCETVKIIGGDSFVVINKADFDKSKHKLYEAKAPKPAKKAK